MFQAVIWHQDQLLDVEKISVNITMSQLEDNGFIDLVTLMLEETSCKASWLCLEVTEGQMMRNPKKAINALRSLHALGFHIAIDDFGTGHSSLAYLKRFPVQELKIDQSFIYDMLENDDNMHIVEAIITLSKSLKIEVIAEGVETLKQKEALITMGCDKVQGFLYKRPMPTDEVTLLLNIAKTSKNLSSLKQSDPL